VRLDAYQSNDRRLHKGKQFIAQSRTQNKFVKLGRLARRHLFSADRTKASPVKRVVTKLILRGLNQECDHYRIAVRLYCVNKPMRLINIAQQWTVDKWRDSANQIGGAALTGYASTGPKEKFQCLSRCSCPRLSLLAPNTS
jgi:hypothetical protein